MNQFFPGREVEEENEATGRERTPQVIKQIRRLARSGGEMAEQKIMGNKGEKSNFSQTCRLLSQYLKEKGSLGGFGLEMPPKPLDQQAKGKSQALTTMSLLPGVDLSGEDQTENKLEKSAPKSMDLFPQNSGFDSAALSKEESAKASDIMLMEKGQLTIFYGGKVMVFDDFPADKAKNLMQMASQESIAAQNFSFSARADCNPKPDSVFAAAASGGRATPPPQGGLSKANASDMPIARKNSLHRFLEKRKDRISTMAPYQVNGSPASTSAEAKPESSQSWLNLGRQASQLEHSPGSSK